MISFCLNSLWLKPNVHKICNSYYRTKWISKQDENGGKFKNRASKNDKQTQKKQEKRLKAFLATYLSVK